MPDFWNLPGLTNFSYSYDRENRLLQVRAIRKDTVFIADYAYDDNGNLIQKTEFKEDNPGKAEVTEYSYDYENRLTLITYPDGSTSEYLYDGAGKRIKTIETEIIRKGRRQKIKTKTTKYFYDGLNVIIERDENDNTTTSYVRGLSYGGNER